MNSERTLRALSNSVQLDLILDDWCMALHGNHDEHQCHRKPGHPYKKPYPGFHPENRVHECYCGVWW